MGDEPCDVGPIYNWQQGVVEATNGNLHPPRHHPAGIAPVEDTAPARAAERMLIDQYRNPSDYAAACRVLHGKPEPVRFEAEGAVFARLIGNS